MLPGIHETMIHAPAPWLVGMHVGASSLHHSLSMSACVIPCVVLYTPAASCDAMAHCRGIEGQLREEAPPRRRFAGMVLLGGLGGDAGDMDNRLMNLLEALEGRLNIHVSCAVYWL